MKIAIAGGTGQIGQMLKREYESRGDQVTILTRNPTESGELHWDGATLGDWANTLEGIDLVINLAGRTVNCRYTEENMNKMIESRVNSTQVIGEAIAKCQSPPPLWLQMSTATIYQHSYDSNNDEETGVIGGNEPDVPDYWAFSVKIAQKWEETLFSSNTPNTRKVALRSAMVMSPDQGGVFMELVNLTKKGLGGPIAGGNQYMSWIHEKDFIGALDLLIKNDFDGVINLASPNPIPQKEFMGILRQNLGMPCGLPTTKWMAEIGAFFLRTDTELVLKSRRVVSKTLQDLGYTFQYPEWEQACLELAKRSGQFLKKHYYKFSFFTFLATVTWMAGFVVFEAENPWDQISLWGTFFFFIAPIPLVIAAIEIGYGLFGHKIYKAPHRSEALVWSFISATISIFLFGVLVFTSIEGFQMIKSFLEYGLLDWPSSTILFLYWVYAPLVGVIFGLPASLVFTTWLGIDAHNKTQLAYQR